MPKLSKNLPEKSTENKANNDYHKEEPISDQGSKNKGGRPAFKPTEEQRNFVKALVMARHTREMIAETLHIDADTLRKHFAEEIRTSRSHMVAKASSALYSCLHSNREEIRLSTAKYVLDQNAKEIAERRWLEQILTDLVGEGDFSRLSDSDFKALKALLKIAGIDLDLLKPPLN